MEKITSKSNDKIKWVKSLQDKKGRQQKQAFYLEGIKVVSEVLTSEKAVDIMFIAYSEDLLMHAHGGVEILKKIEHMSNVISLTESLFTFVCDTKTPQGILVVLPIKTYEIEEVLQKESKILLLDGIQDAGNLGTIIRTADAFSVQTVLCTEGTVDVYSPKVLRSTMGAILRVKVIYLPNNKIEQLKQYGHQLVGTSLQTDQYLEDFHSVPKEIIILGNEANGMSQVAEKACDVLVKIAMNPQAESLNVAIAAGIILHHEQSQRSVK